MSRFEDLEVWKTGMRVAVRVYELFDGSQDFGFRNQICRAAVSVPSNNLIKHRATQDQEPEAGNR